MPSTISLASSSAVVKKLIFVIALGLICAGIGAQETSSEDAFFIKSIHDTALTQGRAYGWLEILTQDVGGRLAGSPGAAAAVQTMYQLMQDELGFDTVYLQPCTAPRWDRGESEQVRIVNNDRVGTRELPALALGNSIGTGPAGLTAEVVEVRSLDEVDKLGTAGVRGKIVFFNRPLDATQLNTFAAYGGAVDQRVFGASRAAKYGAVAVLVRSMTTKTDDVPHTGTLRYEDESQQIPALAVSTRAADLMHQLLTDGGNLRIYLRNTSRNRSPVQTFNVIGEVRGSEFPDEIILTGGHLDSWDVSQGAHDDGAGCVQALQAWDVLRRLGYRPRRTLRVVLFMNEENGLAGGRAYWAASDSAREFHLAAIESDRGGFIPRGFTAEAREDVFIPYLQRLNAWEDVLSPYDLTFKSGGSGADIGGLKSQGGLLLGLNPDSQRYFDYHHTAADRLEAVNERELHLGGAAMGSLVYLIDRYGLGR